jgi:hypothetical protein
MSGFSREQVVTCTMYFWLDQTEYIIRAEFAAKAAPAGRSKTMDMNLKDIKVISHNRFCANDGLISVNEFKKAC